MKTKDDVKNYKTKKGNTKITLHEMIDDAIVDHKYKRKEVAEQLGVNRSTVSNWCNGKRTPDINYLKSLCNLLDMNIYEILDIDSSDTILSPLEEKLIEAYRKASRRQQLAIVNMLNTFVEPEQDK